MSLRTAANYRATRAAKAFWLAMLFSEIGAKVPSPFLPLADKLSLTVVKEILQASILGTKHIDTITTCILKAVKCGTLRVDLSPLVTIWAF